MGMTMTAIPPPTCHVPSCLMFMVDGSYASCHPLSSPFLWWMENKRPRNFVVVTSFWPPYSTKIASSFVGGWGRSHEIVMTSTQFSYWGINLMCERKGQRLDNLATHCISFVERKRNSVKLVETGTFFWSCPCVYFIYRWNLSLWYTLVTFLLMSLMSCLRGIFLMVFHLALTSFTAGISSLLFSRCCSFRNNKII